MLLDIVNYSIEGLKKRGLRSWLTITGIVIGVAAIVLLISLGQGLDTFVKGQLSFFGDDTIVVSPGSGSQFLAQGGTLTEDDWHAIQRLQGVDIATPALEERLKVEYKGESSLSLVNGLKPDFLQVYSAFEVGEGRKPKDGDRGTVVVGYKFAHDFWGTADKREEIQLGRRIIVANKSFTVISILKEQGAGLLSSTDYGVYIPYEDAREIFPSAIGNKRIDALEVKLKPGYTSKTVAPEIEQVVDTLHRIRNSDERDYSVMTSEQVQSYVGNITGALTEFLAVVAAISLLVGAIGVANTMFMSVMERTREIGILKAIGADDRTIMSIFLLESGLIGAVGGVIGVFISWAFITLLVFIVSLVAGNFPIHVSAELAAFGIGVAFTVGMIAGYFPARNAASLPAVEALRYE